MEQVALRLQQIANAMDCNNVDFDVFARSSFNRYYYTLFLIVRETVLEINPRWDAAHSGVPDLLEGNIYRQLHNYRASSAKRQDAQTVEICSRGLSALRALAELMRGAYAVRVLADYNPQIRVVVEANARFALGPINITVAHGWPERGRTLTRQVQRAWRLASGT